MRPLARKILLTQGLIILLVFGISLFAYLSLGEARARASHLRNEYELGIAHENLLSELRDIHRSRVFYDVEKQNEGELTGELRRAFYDGLDRVVSSVEGLALQAGERRDLRQLVAQLRLHLADYRRAISLRELAYGGDDPARAVAAENLSQRAREEMQRLTRESMQERERIVADEIDGLRQAAQEATALALVFSGLALLVGISATFLLSRSINRPVRDMKAATEALSRGEFDLRIDARRQDELGDLARAFNEMAARLQELDEMKSSFVSVVSHELKTPLTSMREAVDLLAEGVGGDLTERQKRLLAITREGMERLVNYVQGILDISRFEAESGQVLLFREPMSIAELVREQAGLIEGRCREAGVDLSLHVDPDLPLVEGDRLRLGQVIANLLDNALKFTPRDGRITVRGDLEPWEDDVGVVMEVADTGAGIAARDIRHIFDKFFQASRTGGGHVQGAGLGLTIVKSLVEAHGGKVSVDSAPGRGTRFRVLLPAGHRAEAAMAG